MKAVNSGRRAFLRSTMAAVAMSPLSPYLTAAADQRPVPPKSANDRPGIGVIGMRYQGSVIADKAKAHGDLVAFCDVDRHVREMAKACFGSTQKIHEDYHALLDDKRIDVILIGAPDHWHAKMAIDAMKAGKDIYVEKPLTLPSISESARRNSFLRLDTALLRDGADGFVSGPGVSSRPAGGAFLAVLEPLPPLLGAFRPREAMIGSSSSLSSAPSASASP